MGHQRLPEHKGAHLRNLAHRGAEDTGDETVPSLYCRPPYNGTDAGEALPPPQPGYAHRNTPPSSAWRSVLYALPGGAAAKEEAERTPGGAVFRLVSGAEKP